MAPRRGVVPKRLEDLADALFEDENEEQVYYLARSEWHMSMAEWDDTAHYEQRMLLDGFKRKVNAEREAADLPPIEDEPRDDASALSAMGITVKTVGG